MLAVLASRSVRRGDRPAEVDRGHRLATSASGPGAIETTSHTMSPIASNMAQKGSPHQPAERIEPTNESRRSQWDPILGVCYRVNAIESPPPSLPRDDGPRRPREEESPKRHAPTSGSSRSSPL